MIRLTRRPTARVTSLTDVCMLAIIWIKGRAATYERDLASHDGKTGISSGR